ncbi:MAG: hypothetical protein AB7T49_04885 [Oligoflexales bacterium]
MRQGQILVLLLIVAFACKKESKQKKGSGPAPAMQENSVPGMPASSAPSPVETKIAFELTSELQASFASEDKLIVYGSYKNKIFSIPVTDPKLELKLPALMSADASPLILMVYSGEKFLFSGFNPKFIPTDKETIKITKMIHEGLFTSDEPPKVSLSP